MPVRPLRQFILIVSLVLLAACSSNPPLKRFPEMTFTNLPAIRFNVGRIEVVSDYQPPADPTHIEFSMPVAPENAVRRWVQDRMQPIGRTGTIRVVIHDAQATQDSLKIDESFSGMFKKEQVARVSMGLDVSVQLLDERQFASAEASSRVQRSRTIPEGLTLNEHDQILYDMVEDLMKQFNQEIDPQIRSQLNSVIAN